MQKKSIINFQGCKIWEKAVTYHRAWPSTFPLVIHNLTSLVSINSNPPLERLIETETKTCLSSFTPGWVCLIVHTTKRSHKTLKVFFLSHNNLKATVQVEIQSLFLNSIIIRRGNSSKLFFPAAAQGRENFFNAIWWWVEDRPHLCLNWMQQSCSHGKCAMHMEENNRNLQCLYIRCLNYKEGVNKLAFPQIIIGGKLLKIWG